MAFLKLPGTVIGPEDDIPHPPEVKNLDYEVELAVIIGKPCVDVSEEEALDYVAGYAAFNDISARDVIRGENKTGIHLMGKSFPGFAPMGPYLVTAEEIPDPQNLKLKLSVNGEVRQDSNLGYMIFKIRDMIAYWSQMGLNPGRRADHGHAARRRGGAKNRIKRPGGSNRATWSKPKWKKSVACAIGSLPNDGFRHLISRRSPDVIVCNISHSTHRSRAWPQRMPLSGRNDSGVDTCFGA